MMSLQVVPMAFHPEPGSVGGFFFLSTVAQCLLRLLGFSLCDHSCTQLCLLTILQ